MMVGNSCLAEALWSDPVLPNPTVPRFDWV